MYRYALLMRAELAGSIGEYDKFIHVRAGGSTSDIHTMAPKVGRTANCELHAFMADGIHLQNRKISSFNQEKLKQSAEEGCQICALLSDTLAAFTNLKPHETVTNDSIFSKRKFVMRTADWSNKNLELYTLPGHARPIEGLPVASNVPSRQDSAATVNQVKDWIGHCTEHHPQCGRGSVRANELPSRLVDVGSVESNWAIKLVETVELKQNADELYTYIALSHCWGKSRSPCLTTAETLERNKTQLPWDSLAKTFQDAIIFTRNLGHRYIWIDSLCIIQGDVEDWANEAARMQWYFSNAYCTLGATWGEDDDVGMFCDRGERYEPKELTYTGPKGREFPIQARWQTTHFTVQIPDWYRSGAMDKGTYPLLSRAWVYQERLLSKRFVHFTQHEVMWECNERSTCQCYSDSEPFPNPELEPEYDSSSYPKLVYRKSISEIYQGDLRNLSEEWMRVVTGYTRLSLTFGKDKFPALSGVNEDIMKGLNTQSQTGLPDVQSLAVADSVSKEVISNFTLATCGGLLPSSLLAHLLWSVHSYPSKRNIRPKEFYAPTWSWASVDSPVNYGTPPRSALERTFASILAISVTPKSSVHPFGELKSGSLTLQSKALHVKLSAMMNRTTYMIDYTTYGADGIWEEIRMRTSFCADYNFWEDGYWHVEKGDPLLILEIGMEGENGYGLVLREKPDQREVWERVGMVTIQWKYMDKCFDTITEEEDFLII